MRTCDEVKVYVGGVLSITFKTEPNNVDLYLTSEQSTSSFSNITLTKQPSTRIFAVRQNFANPDFIVQKSNAEQSELTVRGNNSDFMVVSQYLYNQLSRIEAESPSSETAANVFFKGWIFNGLDQPSNGTQISIVTENQTVNLCLLYTSIVFSYLTFLVVIMPQKVKETFWRQVKKVKPQEKGHRNDRN